jgi:predicted RNA binding protein YcfA (HicA-like mRNA interferase family)
MRLPRDIGGQDLARHLGVYGYSIARQTGSHVMLISNQITGHEHQITFSTGRLLRMATLNNILIEVSAYLGMDKDVLVTALFA